MMKNKNSQKESRKILKDALNNLTNDEILEILKKRIEGIESALLNPIETWQSEEDYQMYLDELVKKFQNNFKKFDVGHDIISAGPKF